LSFFLFVLQHAPYPFSLVSATGIWLLNRSPFSILRFLPRYTLLLFCTPVRFPLFIAHPLHPFSATFAFSWVGFEKSRFYPTFDPSFFSSFARFFPHRKRRGLETSPIPPDIKNFRPFLSAVSFFQTSFPVAPDLPGFQHIHSSLLFVFWSPRLRGSLFPPRIFLLTREPFFSHPL